MNYPCGAMDKFFLLSDLDNGVYKLFKKK